MFEQTPKQLIDTGEIGNASTGDILFDGGNKINDNINAIYNAFGDQRKMSLDNGQGATVGQVIHATGYYQKSTSALDYQTPVENGSMHDIDTTSGAVQITLSKGVRGEAVFFCNSNGSFSTTRPLTIDANDNFINVGRTIKITSPYVFVKCWCISDSDGRSVWDYSIESMFGEKHIPTDGTWATAVGGTVSIPLFHQSEFSTVKYLVTARTTDGTKQKSSEINILVDTTGRQVISTEYAVIRIGADSETKDLFVPTWSINSATGYVTLTITSDIVGLRVAVKAIATQKFGVPR